MPGVPAKCPKGIDRLAYASGYIEGKAQREKGAVRVIEAKPDRRQS